jgi:hypothetical protein
MSHQLKDTIWKAPDEEEVMSNRRRLARERLEIYLVYLLMAYRRLILISGLLFLAYTIVTLVLLSAVSFAGLLTALVLVLLGTSYNAILYTARLGAWIGTLWTNDD